MAPGRFAILSLTAITVLAAISCAVPGLAARPSEDLTNLPSLQTEDTASVGRHLTQSPPGPGSAGCAAAGVSCCYSPTWWIEQQTPASLTCESGTLDSQVTIEDIMQACNLGNIGTVYECRGAVCGTWPGPAVSCTYYENIGDFTGPQPCGSVDFNGQSITVYDPAWLTGNNDEIVWEDAGVAANEPAGVEACYGSPPPPATYTFTATYSKSSSWNIGIQLGAKIFSNYEAKLTAGFSQTYTAGTNTGISVTAQPYQHGTVTRGTLVHHTIGWWDVTVAGNYQGCSHYRADNVAADLIRPSSDPHFPTDYGAEVKPCGYPLLNGHLQ